MADKDLWFALQNLNLGSERSPIKLSIEATKQRDAEHRLSLVVKGLHPSQNPAGIKVMMPKIWKLEGRVTSRINEDGTVQFFFKHEHQMLNVLDNGPWTYKDWLVIVDKWTRRNYPDYLHSITFWVKLLNIPDDSKENRIIEEIGGVLGHVTEVIVQQPTAELAGEIWVRVPIDISARLIFARYFHLDSSGEPVLIRYKYDKLRKLCSSCGSFLLIRLPHVISKSTKLNIFNFRLLLAPISFSHPSQDRDLEGMNQMENMSHTHTEAADDTMGETSENLLPTGSQGEFNNFLHPADLQDRTNETFVIREVGSASIPAQVRGTKRKADDTNNDDEVSTTRQRTQALSTTQAQGEVATPNR